jgi:hypothetical protein
MTKREKYSHKKGNDKWGKPHKPSEQFLFWSPSDHPLRSEVDFASAQQGLQFFVAIQIRSDG